MEGIVTPDDFKQEERQMVNISIKTKLFLAVSLLIANFAADFSS